MSMTSPSAASGQPVNAIRLAVVLHAHAAFVPAPARRHGHAEALYASLAQAVIPLLNTLHRLSEEGIDAPITLALPPVWCEMMSDLSLPVEFEKYLHHHIEIGRAHGREFAAHGLDDQRALALFWENWFQGIERDYEETFHRDIIGALRDLNRDGRIELLAVPATEAFLPALPDESAIETQLQVGIDSFKKYFAGPPRALWLPTAIAQASMDAHQQLAQSRLMRALARRGFDALVAGAPAHARDDATRYLAAHSPLLRALIGDEGAATEEAGLSVIEGVAALRSHPALTEQVWNRELGYCGDEHFLDDERRYGPGALRLWRITDAGAPASRREVYEPFGNASICEVQAEHWLKRVREVAAAPATRGGPICATFDIDLFGTHWFEGHNWLYRILKKAAADSTIEVVTASGATALDAGDSREMIASFSSEPSSDAPPASTAPSCTSLWFNAQTAWLWAEIDHAHEQMSLLARQHRGTANAKLSEILDQCGREVLLMQSIDWPIALSTTCGSTAASHFADHADALRRLLQIAQTVARGEFMAEGERAFLASIADRDDLFPDLSFALWAD